MTPAAATLQLSAVINVRNILTSLGLFSRRVDESRQGRTITGRLDTLDCTIRTLTVLQTYLPRRMVRGLLLPKLLYELLSALF